jgi:hypothetical protein
MFSPFSWGRKQIEFPKNYIFWFLENRTIEKCKKKKKVILSIIRHRQNPLESNFLYTLFPYSWCLHNDASAKFMYWWVYDSSFILKYRVLSAQAGWALTHTSPKDTEQSTTEACITLDGVTPTHWSGDNWMIDLQFDGRWQCLPIICSRRLISLQNEHPI